MYLPAVQNGDKIENSVVDFEKTCLSKTITECRVVFLIIVAHYVCTFHSFSVDQSLNICFFVNSLVFQVDLDPVFTFTLITHSWK